MKTITEILKKNNSPLAKLLDQISNAQNFAIIFQAALDKNLNTHCHFANYKNSELLVTVANACWATKLRYAIPDIIKNLRVQPEFKNITKIRYTIAPSIIQQKTKQKQKKLSPNNEILWQKTLKDLRKKNK